MTETDPLRDYSRSRAVLIGAWDYAHLPPVPAARNSLVRVAGLLTGPLCDWPKSRVEVLRNVRRRDRLPDQLMELFDGVEDVALLYFVGHGQLYEDELCLALRESPEAGPRRTTVGLPFSDVRAALRACDAQTKIVILDCCFAGHVARTEHSLATTSTNVIDKTLGTGAVTMAASGAYRTAWFESDPNVANPQTYFTKYLVDMIEQGIPDYPQGLPLGPIYARTADALARDHRPEPTRSVRHDADRFILARNIAKPAEPPAAPPSLDSGAEAAVPTAHRGPARRSVILGGLTALAAASGATLIGLRLNEGASGHQSRGTAGPHLWFTLTDDSDDWESVVLFSPDGKTLASSSGNRTVRLWDVAARKRTATLTGHYQAVNSVAFSPDGKTLASGTAEGPIQLWDVTARKHTATLTGHARAVLSVAFSPDGKTLASSTDDGAIQLWDVTTRKHTATLTGHTEPVNSVAFSPDGKTLASSTDDGAIQLWDVTTRKHTATLTGHTEPVNSVAFSPDGKTLASSSNDWTVRLWDVAARKRTATLTGNTDPVNSVAFSPDGKTLASASGTVFFTHGDNTVRLWDVAARKRTATLTGHHLAVNSVAFSPDGKTLASASSDHTIRLWKFT
ncbi:caspase, EACC1-associated type [Streptomyces inhibens]|uniref:caspase, EACC1-associated type n=1 Tax=Streptomyces inhibens TaxID=2293571 RepID=UPI00402AD4D5